MLRRARLGLEGHGFAGATALEGLRACLEKVHRSVLVLQIVHVGELFGLEEEKQMEKLFKSVLGA